MTAAGGLDGVTTVGAVRNRGRLRPVGEGFFTDALSGPDGMADPAPWPVDPDGLGAAGEVFPDALGPAGPGRRVGRRTTVPPVGARPVAAAPPGPAPRRTTTPPPPAAPRPLTPVRRAAAPPRPAPTPARVAPPLSRRPGPTTRSGTGWSTGGTTARDFLRQAREAGGVAAATAPFRQIGSDRRRAATADTTRPDTTRPTRPAGSAGQWADRPTRNGPRRRPGSTLIFVVFVLTVLLLFGSGLAAGVVDLVRSLLDR